MQRHTAGIDRAQMNRGFEYTVRSGTSRGSPAGGVHGGVRERRDTNGALFARRQQCVAAEAHLVD
jgi:hypothetical protein